MTTSSAQVGRFASENGLIGLFDSTGTRLSAEAFVSGPVASDGRFADLHPVVCRPATGHRWGLLTPTEVGEKWD